MLADIFISRRADFMCVFHGIVAAGDGTGQNRTDKKGRQTDSPKFFHTNFLPVNSLTSLYHGRRKKSIDKIKRIDLFNLLDSFYNLRSLIKLKRVIKMYR